MCSKFGIKKPRLRGNLVIKNTILYSDWLIHDAPRRELANKIDPFTGKGIYNNKHILWREFDCDRVDNGYLNKEKFTEREE